MRAFASAFPDPGPVQRVVARSPWGHAGKPVEAAKSPSERLWYARQAVEHGWSGDVLVHRIGGGLHARQGKAPTNSARTLPAPQSDLAQESIRDPAAPTSSRSVPRCRSGSSNAASSSTCAA